MNKWIVNSLCALLICTACAGCTQQQAPPAEGQSEPSAIDRVPDNLRDEQSAAGSPADSSAPQPPGESAQVDEPAGAVSGRQITLYLYRPEQNNYFPTAEPMGEDSGPGAILDTVTHVLGLPSAYETGVEQKEGTLILDFQGAYIDDCLTDAEQEDVFLNTLCTTIAQNLASVGSIELRRDGGSYRSLHRTLEAGAPYQWPELVIGGGTAAEYAELRARIPYDGMRSQTVEALRFNIVPTDATGEELTRYLARVGDPGKAVESALDLGTAYMQARALENVMWYTTVDYGQSEVFHPELLPITTAVGDANVAMGEHVVQTMQELFGNVPFENASLPQWQWHPVEGVYTPPHTGGGSYVQPVILSYEERGDSYRIELVYLRDAMGVLVDEQGAAISEQNLRSTAETAMRRREVIVDKKTGGGLLFHSHRYL